MITHRKNELGKNFALNSDLFHKDRGSIVAFMYGAKLAVFAKKLENVDCHGINGYGPISIKDGRPIGVGQFDQRMNYEFQEFSEVLARIDQFLDGKKSNKIIEDIHLKLKTILDSETYKYSRKPEQMRLMPAFLNALSLRVFCKPDNRDMSVVYDSYYTTNYDFEKTTFEKNSNSMKTKNNRDFAVIYPTPKIGSKYSLIANMFYLIETDLQIINKRIDVIENDQKEYEILLKSILDGLRKHYTLDPDDEEFVQKLREKHSNPIDLLEMEKFFIEIEAVDQICSAITKISFRKNELQEEIKDLFVKLRDQAYMQTTSTVDYGLVRLHRERELERLLQEEIKLKQNLSDLVNHMRDHNVSPSIEERLVSKGLKVKIAKERYFKPIVTQKVDQNIYREEYKKNVTNYIDISKTKYYDSEFYKNAELDSNMKNWINPPDLWVYNAKKPTVPVNNDLYVDKIILPNEEREKDLLRTQILGTKYFKTIDK